MKSREIKHLAQRQVKKMELQQAWDIISDFVVDNTTGGHCAFVDILSTPVYGHINLHTPDSQLLQSTKNYRK